ncbi:aspartate-alanine antiporter [Enterococcus faecalis]|uniref:aspartate-alanine antiporter n=1 Tax=Enterococcus faecalis TaxID=1351 RepID=UPI002DBD3FC0|nr:aspartate-alanine antiporter [Enterococcus faecalis]MEB7792119.1 aspartate-alanine antiporter [Enterococcus faecalis]MEB7810094.1 aspartate-alanine antiporter [Enterococcus faecalis]
MWKLIINYLLANKALCIFISLALGYWIGRLKIKSFILGPTVGILIVSLVLGQIGHFSYDTVLKDIFLDVFIFTIGYEVGPSFVASLKRTGIKSLILSVFFFFVAFALSYTLFRLFDIPPGEAIGILAGSLTQSTMIGSASSAFSELNLSDTAQKCVNSQMAVGYAVTYVFGMIGVMLFIKNIAPILLRINLREETKKEVEATNFSNDQSDKPILVSRIKMRAFEVGDHSLYIGKKIADIEKKYNHSFVIEQILRKDKQVELTDTTRIEGQDKITLIGDVTSFIQLSVADYGTKEIYDDATMDINLQTVHVILTKKVFNNNELLDTNIIIAKIIRNGREISKQTPYQPGDEVVIIGPERTLNTIIPEIGYEKMDGQETDMIFLSTGIVIGTLIGSLTFSISGISMSLGVIGSLFSGLYFGWVRERHQNIGAIPGPTRWFIKSLGLNLYIATLGLEAGSSFLPALKSMGIKVLLIGAVIAILPHFATLYFNKYVLKLTPIENISGLIGAGTSTPSLNAVTEETKSSIFTLNFTPAFAIGNILLTMLGPIMVHLLI